MTKTTIDERISKLKAQIEKLDTIKVKHIGITNRAVIKIAQKHEKIMKLEAKKSRQQKDAAIGDKLVESGVITEQQKVKVDALPQGGIRIHSEKQNQEIQKLPEPERKSNPPIYNPEV